jgi:two-component system response regulator FixJ
MIAIVDDDEAMRQSTSQVLRRSGYDTQIFVSGDDFIADETAETLSCILLDLHMPGKDGLAVLAVLRDRGDSPPVIVVTAHGDLAVAVDAMKLGACDFIEKPYEGEELLTAIRAALDSNFGGADANLFRARATALVDTLSSRQRQVLLGILKGLQNKIIAFELGLSIRTVETYRAQLLEKLHVRGTAEAVRLALAAGVGEERFGQNRNGSPFDPGRARFPGG